jgi:hypothetical protein
MWTPRMAVCSVMVGDMHVRGHCCRQPEVAHVEVSWGLGRCFWRPVWVQLMAGSRRVNKLFWEERREGTLSGGVAHADVFWGRL